MVNRKLDKEIENHYERNKSALLLTGARQTGKTVNGRTLYLPIYMTMFIRKYTTEEKQVYHLDLSNLKVNAKEKLTKTVIQSKALANYITLD